MELVTFRRPDADDPGAEAGVPSMRDRGLGFEALEETAQGARRIGALLPGGSQAGSVVDLNRALAIKLAGEDVGAPEAEAESLLPPDMRRLLAEGDRALDAARAAPLRPVVAETRLRAIVETASRKSRLPAPPPSSFPAPHTPESWLRQSRRK